MQEVLDTQASIMKFRLCNLCKEQSLAIALLLKALLRGEKAYPDLKVSLSPINIPQNKNTKKLKTSSSTKATISQANTDKQEEQTAQNETQSIPQIFPTLQIDS
ncbi:hypothetical protein B6S12_00720 [Helicobacter valdiviensis]|uniref:Uncharacterized protein n=1 Tax=Helicobacter valdiviensis TaxID=1458358 RepID=A0A2W6N0A5_9HELI|nr:hypothetical protein [Helicobacter valdiviensis]PZT49148.1 hypothetical protein B6S12_00720 [Helicobacter valdiviensis]